ncbi:MAG: class I SAM-dependent methyltransferase [Chloroflexota bacterium]
MHHDDRVTQSEIQKYITLQDQAVLEIGCGDGRVTTYLVDQPRQLIALDPDPSRLKQAQSRFDQVGFFLGSGETLAFPDNSFDTVFFTLSLHHQDSVKALQEAYRVLKPSGQVLILEPANDGELEKICNIFNDETVVLSQALSAIESSKFIKQQSHTFYTEWAFADAEALYNWLFTYYEVPFNQTDRDQVIRLLGQKATESPLVLQDKTMIACLSKQ